MIHHTNNAIIIQGKVYELQKLEDTSMIDACKSCALVAKCAYGCTDICQVIHNVNKDCSTECYNYKELKLKPTMSK